MSGNGTPPSELINAPDAVDFSGAVEMAVGPEHGKVVLAFKTPQTRVDIDPPVAVALAKQLLDLAQVCGFNVVLQVPRRAITREQRNHLVFRALHIYRDLNEKRKPPHYIVQQIVDSILSAID